MTADRDLQRLVEALRSPARPDELSGATGVLNAMVSAHTNPKGPSRMFRISATAKTALFASIGVVSLAGVAAATGAIDLPLVHVSSHSNTVADATVATTDSSTTEPITVAAATGDVTVTSNAPEPTDASTTTTTEAETDDTSATTGADTATGAAADSNGVVCVDGNHGATVSGVAKSDHKSGDQHSAVNHGDAVSAAAHSGCGKNNDDTTDATNDAGDDSSTTATTEGETESSDAPKGRGHSSVTTVATSATTVGVDVATTAKAHGNSDKGSNGNSEKD